jgi:hypothetical protein
MLLILSFDHSQATMELIRCFVEVDVKKDDRKSGAIGYAG